jgi:hypothetical protein
MKEQRHVMPSPGGGWDVARPGSSRPSSHHDTQEAAISRARMVLREQGGGELVIRGADGEITRRNRIVPESDPLQRRR